MYTTVGILGGGQLARMMVMAGKRMGLTTKVLDPKPGPSIDVGAQAFLGDFCSSEHVVAFGSTCEVVTCDLERVSIEGMEALVAKGIPVHPSPFILAVIQDKYRQKQWLARQGFDQPAFGLCNEESCGGMTDASVFKKRCGGYDGRGVFFGTEDLGLSHISEDYYWEEPVEIEKEVAISVCVFRDQIVLYPLVHTVQQDGICVEVRCPASVSKDVHDSALLMAKKFGLLMQGEKSLGIYALELFVTKTHQVLINEISPRPHNSAHYTIEACVTDQFENHLRAICGLRPGSAALKVARACMTNLLGTSNPLLALAEHTDRDDDREDKVHWYGKDPPKPKRKMGHITSTSVHRTTTPLVAIIMGSSSDLPTMEGARSCLDEVKIPYSCQIVSAHRDPEGMVAFARDAETMGYKVIIAAAGGAAHLPGMVASLTPLPVIGVPVPTKDLGGQDSLYSIVQMPDGVPVATVGIGKARNAAILALRILGTSIPAAFDASKNVLTKNHAKVLSQRKGLR